MKELQAEATKPRYIHNNIRPSKAKSQTFSTYKFEKIAEERGVTREFFFKKIGPGHSVGKKLWCFSYSKNIALLWIEDQAVFY